MKKVFIGILVMGIFALGIGLGIKVKSVEKAEENKYIAFVDEVYGVIKDNYWNKLSDEQLNNIFVLATEKITGQIQNIKPKDENELEKMLEKLMDNYDSDQKKAEFCSTLTDMVLTNLEPFGRSRLYTLKDEKALSDNVSNKTEVDQYKVLEVEKTASEAGIKKAYEVALKKPENKEKVEEIKKAYKVLSDPVSKKNYDLAGVEPTMDYKLIKPNVFYIHLTKFSPTTFDELQRVSEKVDSNLPVDSLIFDLRDNVGGAIDGLPYFLGPFIGNDQYAYQFMHQGEKTDFKTRIGWLPGLVRYKKVVILINENSQSTAEVMAATLKKYNVGILVGVPTRGWGTVEKVFDLKHQLSSDQKNSVFLVHSLTLREDGQPIEGKGVEPVININDKGWDKQLNTYFNSPELIEAVKEVLN